MLGSIADGVTRVTGFLSGADAIATMQAFRAMGGVSDEQISRFYEEFAQRLESAAIWSEVTAANAKDLERATQRGRSTQRRFS